MTRTEERLTDALDTAARAIDEHRLHPLHLSERRRPHPALAAPVAAAASVLLVVGLAAALAAPRLGQGGTASPASSAAPDPYYMDEDVSSGQAVVRSTATGAVTAIVPVQSSIDAPGWDDFASAANGLFFVAGWTAGNAEEKLFRFRIRPDGKVSGFSVAPGGTELGGGRWSAVAMAASADGSQVAVAFDPTGLTESCSGYTGPSCPRTLPSDYIVVVNTVTGKKIMWQGWRGGQNQFNVDDLSWADDGHELVFFGEQCVPGSWMATQDCGHARVAEARTLDPADGGGRLDSGRLLLRQSASSPYIAQALMSPDGSTLTELVLTGKLVSGYPQNLSVEQISAATGKRLRVLYQRASYLSAAKQYPDPLLLVPDGTGQNWLLDVTYCGGCAPGGFNGWISQRKLVPLKPADGALAAETW
jgi:hypothetical protein